MRKALTCVVVLLSGIRLGSAQVLTAARQLEGLPNGDAIGLWSAHLPSRDLEFLKQLTSGMVSACIENAQRKEPQKAAELFSQIRVGHVALSPSQPSGLVVQGTGACMCDASGNCPFWIIDHQPQLTVVLKAHSIKTFALIKSLHAGHFDLVLGTSGPGVKDLQTFQKQLQTFQFNGKRYQRKECATLDWADQYGTLLIPPKVSSSRCASNGGTVPSH